MTARLIDDAHWQILVSAAHQTKQSARYQNASQKAPFDAAYAQLENLEQNRDVTLEQFLKVQESLAHAVTQLNGQETTTFVLKQAISDAELLMETSRYVNASPAAKENLDTALQDAQAILATDGFVLQTKVDQTVEKLQKSATALSGLETDFSQLALVFRNAQSDLNTLRYLNATVNQRENFKKYFNQAKQLLSQAAANQELNAPVADLSKLAPDFQSVPQETIDLTASELIKARNALNGKSSNLKSLQKAVKKMSSVSQTKRYQDAYDSRKAAFDLALSEAQTALKDEKTTQKLADRLVSQLNVTYETLNGEEVEQFIPVVNFENADQAVADSPADSVTAENTAAVAEHDSTATNQSIEESVEEPIKEPGSDFAASDPSKSSTDSQGVVQTAPLNKPTPPTKERTAATVLGSMLGFKRGSK